jgi:hypothetical protein
LEFFLVKMRMLFRRQTQAKRPQHGESARDPEGRRSIDQGGRHAGIQANVFGHAQNVTGLVGHLLSDRQKYFNPSANAIGRAATPGRSSSSPVEIPARESDTKTDITF